MNLKMMNEAFKRNYGGLASEMEDASPKTLLRNKLTESVSRVSNRDNLGLVESVMRATLEDMYPDHSWWEVTNCVINESLFNDGVDGTISAIVEGLSESVINEDINPVHKDALRDKVWFCYSRDDLEEQGADLSQLSDEDIQRILNKGATDADIEKMFGAYSFVDDDFGVDSSLQESVDKVKSILSPLVSNGKMRAFGNNEKVPRGFSFLSSNGTSGEVKYNGVDYAYALVGDELRVMTSKQAGDNWSETLFKDNSPKKHPVEESVSNPDRTRGKVSKNLSKSVDKDLVRDLTLIIENDGDIYRRFTTPVINNLKRKKAKGQFDEELAVQAFVHVVENALRQPYFYRYYSYDIKTVSVPERYAVAKELLDGAMDEIEFDEGSLTEAPIYDLDTQHDSRKSFYSKAKVDTGDAGDKNKLYSYNTLVAEIVDGKPVVHGTYSATTLRHIKEWLKQLGYRADNAKQIMQDYGAVNESVTGKDDTHSDVVLDRRQPDFHSEYMRLTELGYETVWSGEGKIKLKYTGKSVPKRREFFAEDLRDLGIENNIIEFPSGDYVYVDYQDGKLIAGGATNRGIIPEYEVDFDEDLGVDANLENLYDEIVRNNPEFLGESLCRKLKECLRRLRESSISPEDKADSDLIRGMIAKMQKRSNAKFTPEELAVMDKYGITRDNWNKKLLVGDRELNPNYDGANSNSYEFSRATPTWHTVHHRNGDTSKINYADRARKLPQRDGNQVVNKWTPNGYINAHTRRDGSTLQSVERAVTADRDREPVKTMERHLWDRNYSQGRIDNAQSEYDNTMNKARAEYDRQLRYAADAYKRDTVDARKSRDVAQDRIDKMLKRK